MRSKTIYGSKMDGSDGGERIKTDSAKFHGPALSRAHRVSRFARGADGVTHNLMVMVREDVRRPLDPCPIDRADLSPFDLLRLPLSSSPPVNLRRGIMRNRRAERAYHLASSRRRQKTRRLAFCRPAGSLVSSSPAKTESRFYGLCLKNIAASHKWS